MRWLIAVVFAAFALSPGVSAARPPAQDDEPAAGTSSAKGGDGDEEAELGARNIATARVSEDKSWYVSGEVAFRMLAVVDKDPANDRSMSYRLQGGYSPLDWLTVFGRIGVDQKFVSVDGESGVRMQDTLLGAYATHSVSLAGLGWDRKITFLHRLGFYLPTSYQSHLEDLYTAPEWLTQARLRLVDTLYFGLTGILQYRFHKYAEHAGLDAGTLPRFVAAGLAFLEYSPLTSTTYGTLTLGGDFYGYETVDYPALKQDSIDQLDLPQGVKLDPQDTQGAQASNVYLDPQYGYDLYITYVPPIQNFAFTVSLEQGANVIRGGEPRIFFFHRDETTLAFTLTGRY